MRIGVGGGAMEKLKEAAKCAAEDYRDVISGAEYDRDGNRIADYNKPF